MGRGGFRIGAGRPPAIEPKLSLIIRLRTAVAKELRKQIREKKRSEFIERLIVEELGL